MPYSIDTSSELIKVTYWGELTKKDIRDVLNESLNAISGQAKTSDRIEDLRKVTAVAVGFADLWGLAQDVQKIEIPGVVKVAIVTSGLVQYGIARMFQAVLSHPKIRIEVFSTEDEAHEWLSLMGSTQETARRE